MKILIAPMNWGLGHATRCIPLIDKYIDDNAEVVIAGDGESLLLLRKRYPQLRYVELPKLNLRYSARKQQVGAMILSLPKIVVWSIRDHYALKALCQSEHFDRIISDNRFGCYTSLIPEKVTNPRPTETIYITHQIMIKMPRMLRWAEPIIASIHRHIIVKYSQCWIPDNAGKENLSGDLSHKHRLPKNARFIGPLSRFVSYLPKPTDKDKQNTAKKYDVVAVLSGLEPQRTMFERQIISQFDGKKQKVLIVRGKISDAKCEIKHSNITLVPYLDDKELVPHLLFADQIIARSGYSTLMDMQCIGCMQKAILYPTPGQTEQQYLAQLHHQPRITNQQ